MSNFNIEGFLQRATLSLILKNSEFLERAYYMVEPQIFSDPWFQIICRQAYNYYTSYKETPSKEIMCSLLEAKYPREQDQTTFKSLLDVLYEMLANAEYILDQLNEFVRRRAIINAITEVQELIEGNKFEEIENILTEALRKGDSKINLPKRYLQFDPVDFMNRRAEMEDGLKLNFGRFDALATNNFGIGRGKLICIEGDEKGKKSFCLIHIAIESLIQGMNILFVTCEMSKGEVEDRLDCSVTSQIKSKLDVFKVDSVRKRMSRYGGEIWIEEFPQMICTEKDIRRIINNIEIFENKTIDVVIVDYADIMESNTKIDEERHRHSSIFSSLKQLASERNIRVFTATQVKMKAVGKTRKGKTDTGEDKRKLGHVDMMIGLGQDLKDEKQQNIMWITVVANRFGLEGIHYPIMNDIPKAQFFVTEVTLTDQGEYEPINGNNF